MPSNETGKWDDVVEKKFAVSDPRSAIAIVGLMRTLRDLSGECKLLMITASLNVCLLENKGKEETKLLKKLFHSKNPDGELIGAKIFDEWKREALETLEKLAPTYSQKDWYENTVAFHLLCGYTKFVWKCFVIDENKQLKVLNAKYKLGWNAPEFLNDVSSYVLLIPSISCELSC
jgi:hypothetical protein